MTPSALELDRPPGRLLLHDGLVILALCGVTVALFGVTLFLFRSFQEHRAELGRQWSARGRQALRTGRPADAVAALRVALSYEPDERADQFTLAQALAASGHSEEAMNYFLALWEQRPGDGITNLQLARLERERGDAPEAINYYRAAIFGSWEGDGTLRRRETRVELADYFKQRNNDAAARQELLIAAGNAPPEEYLEVSLGDRLEAIGDTADALQLYTKALQADPHRRSALIKAGKLSFTVGDYANASRLLDAALHEKPTGAAPASEDAELQALVTSARRIPELSLSRDQPEEERAAHLLLATAIAHKRLAGCSALVTAKPNPQPAGSAPAPPKQTASAALEAHGPALAALQVRWKGAAGALTRSNLVHDASAADAATQLIEDTEAQTAMACGAPTGDDALLLKLAGPAAGAPFTPPAAAPRVAAR